MSSPQLLPVIRLTLAVIPMTKSGDIILEMIVFSVIFPSKVILAFIFSVLMKCDVISGGISTKAPLSLGTFLISPVNLYLVGTQFLTSFSRRTYLYYKAFFPQFQGILKINQKFYYFEQNFI